MAGRRPCHTRGRADCASIKYRSAGDSQVGEQHKQSVVVGGNLTSTDGYVFDASASHWRLSRDVTVSPVAVKRYSTPELAAQFTVVVAHYAQNYSAHHTSNLCDRFRAYVQWWSGQIGGAVDKVSVASLVSFRGTLGREHEWYLGVLRGLLKSWGELRLPGVEDGVLSWFEEGHLRGNIKGRAVQTMSPTRGPLSDLEFSALHQALTDAFADNSISLRDYVLSMLLLETGRRPAQIADLKCCDLIVGRSSEGLCQYVLNIPRRKIRGGQFRSQLKQYALLLELGTALEKLIAEVREKFLSYCPSADQQMLDLVPIFPARQMLSKIAKLGRSELRGLIETDALHTRSDTLADRLVKVINGLAVASERTTTLHIFPTRLRRTLATRAAREGYGELVIAELLDHSDTQNVRVYTQNVPEHLDAIDEAVARQLAPLAQAFAGVLINEESEAVRGGDPNSRVRADGGEIAGICGHFGFCGALAPIACYTCKFYQPFLDGPHQEILEGLLAERERIARVTGDKTIAAVNDRTIFAVMEVIQRCEIVTKEREKARSTNAIAVKAEGGTRGS